MAMSREMVLSVLLKAVDQLSAPLDAITNRFSRMSDKIAAAGERLTAFGEKMSVAGVLMQQGAEKITRVADAIMEPALAMEQTQARLMATSNLTNSQIEAVTEHFEKFSTSIAGAAASGDQGVAVFNRAYAALHNVTAATQMADEAIKASSLFGMDAANSMNLLLAAHDALGSTADNTNRILGATITAFSVTPDKMDAFVRGIERGAGAASLLHGNLGELSAIMGEAGTLMQGRGAQVFASLLGELPGIAAKAGLDSAHGLFGVLDSIQSRIVGRAMPEQLDILKGMGISGDRASIITELLDNLDKIHAGYEKITGSKYTDFMREVAAVNGTGNKAIDRFHHALENLETAMGKTVTPTLEQGLERLIGLLDRATQFAGKHSTMTKILALSLGGMSVALTVAAGGLATLGAMAMFTGNGMKVLAAMTDWETIALKMMYAWDYLAAASTGVLTAALSVFEAVAAIVGAPVWLVVLALAALAAGVAYAAYQIYEHWDGIIEFFQGLPDKVMGAFKSVLGYVDSLGTLMYNAGANLFHLLAAGMESAVMYPIHVAENLAGKIAGYFQGHSPPPLGPLHQIDRITIMETIAERLQPAPIMRAIESAARIAAIGIPLAFAMPTFASDRAPLASVRPSGGRPIELKVEVHFGPFNLPPGANAAEWRKELEANAREVVKVIKRELARQERTEL